MRIAVWHNLPSGGGKRALYYHVRGLLQRGHTVEAWCPPTADQCYLPLRDLIPEHTVPFEWQLRDGRSAPTRLIAGYRNIVDKIKAMDRHCRECAEQINRGGYDVLFANACTFFRVTSIGRHVKIPKLIYLQEPYRWLYEALPELPWVALSSPPGRHWSVRELKRFVGNLVQVQGLRVQAREEAVNARAFDAILANSFFSRESILRAYGLEAKVCYLGVDTDLFQDQRRKREPFVVSVGAITQEKRLDLIIRAISLLPQPRPALVWIANVAIPSLLEEMRSLAGTAGVDFRAEVGIKDQEVVNLLNRAGVLVYAPRLEPFGFAPLEAGACGLPVVAVAEGGVRETVFDGVNGLLVEDDAESIAQAMRRVLMDPDYANQLGSAGSELAKRRWSMAGAIDRLEHRLTGLTQHRLTDPLSR